MWNIFLHLLEVLKCIGLITQLIDWCEKRLERYQEKCYKRKNPSSASMLNDGCGSDKSES